MGFDTWHMTHDAWHMTHDTWHMTLDTWHITHDTSPDMEKDIFCYPSKVSAKTILPKKMPKLWQKWICNKTAKNVFDNKYKQNKTAKHL